MKMWTLIFLLFAAGVFTIKGEMKFKNNTSTDLNLNLEIVVEHNRHNITSILSECIMKHKIETNLSAK